MINKLCFKITLRNIREKRKLRSILKEVREKCDYLLNNDKVEINGRTYIKQEADNVITNYIKEVLDKENI